MRDRMAWQDILNAQPNNFCNSAPSVQLQGDDVPDVVVQVAAGVSDYPEFLIVKWNALGSVFPLANNAEPLKGV